MLQRNDVIQLMFGKCARLLMVAALLACSMPMVAQKLSFSHPHGFCDAPFSLDVTAPDDVMTEGTVIRYTLDCSEPVATSALYGGALEVKGNTVVRAAAFRDEERVSDICTATYLFIDDVLAQPADPEGYPSEWGAFTQSVGTAIADYAMDEEMVADPVLRERIVEGFKSLPILSIVTDKDNLFSHENDPDRGGIYIFTGPPVGDATGHGWTRFANVEYWNAPADVEKGEGFSVTCGLRLHGGHGRLAEKNPKHSFRLVFKKEYGEKSLKYPLFGEDEPAKFDQLVLRCHFGNAWQHWLESNREKAQYTRDVWARRMQRKMGRTSVNALYVHLFLNGMYWGLYNIAERVDEQFGKDHLGGAKTDMDVIKIEEDGGNHLEAAEGDMDAYNQMVQVAAQAADDTYYNLLQGKDANGNLDPTLEPLLDIDAFIDYMLINQYGGNTDWDHHNWYAIRRRGEGSQGYRFLCWDSELILDNPTENVLGKNQGKSYPTGIFQSLMQNDDFARRYLNRAKEVLAEGGVLGPESAVEVWDSLYNTIALALYDEAARWGDYRRDVHPYTSKGKLYTVDGTYMTERNRLLTQYFPGRSATVLNSIVAMVNVDDFEMPDGWRKMTAAMFREWSGSGADAEPLDKGVTVDWKLRQNVGGWEAVAGFVGVEENRFADVTSYTHLVLRGSGNGLRILANRLVAHGSWKQIVVSFNENDPYWDAQLGAIVVPLEDLMNKPDTDGKNRVDDFVHLHALKVEANCNVNLRGAYLIPSEELTDIAALPMEDARSARSQGDGSVWHTLDGRPLWGKPTVRGVYLYHGKKVMIK